MNCPVCGNDLGLPDKLKETVELHYDCPGCFSSLFLSAGKCEVLSRGIVSDRPPATETAGETDSETEEALLPSTVPPSPSAVASDSGESAGMEPPPSSRNRTEEAVPEEDSPVSPAPSSRKSDESVEEALSDNPEVPSLNKEEAAELKAPSPHSADEENIALTAVAEGLVPSSEETDSPVVASPPPESAESFEFSEESAGTKSSADVPDSSTAGQASGAQPSPAGEKQNLGEERDREEDFSDVEKFGNSLAPAGKGAFYYDVTVEEIDSEDLRAETEEVLEDPALKLAPEQLNMSVEEGRLKVSKISPVQAHVIVKSLLGLSLKISWEQSLAADALPSEPVPTETD